MGIPLPRVVADVGPGGPLVTSMKGINALHNDLLLNKMQQIKNQYAPQTLQAEAASKLAYANLLGPQFVAKLLGNDAAVANLGSDRANDALNTVANAGMRQSVNPFSQSQQYSGIGQPSTNAKSASLWDRFTNAISHRPPQQSGNENAINMPPMAANNDSNPNVSYEGPGPIDSGNPFVGRAGYRPPAPQQQPPSNPMEMELTEGQAGQSEPTWEEKTGKFKGTIEQGKESGKYRAEALRDIGKAQIALSNSGAALNSMTKIITSPEWQEMRNKIPAFQDKQLGILKVTGTDAQKKLIGEYTAAAESLIANTVAGMGTRHLVREYDLAQRQKINDSDTTQSAEGKLKNVIQLHDIAEKKNDLIAGFLRKGDDEADAVKKANKLVDVDAIDRQTDKILERKVSVTNRKTGETKLMTVKEAQKLGVPNV